MQITQTLTRSNNFHSVSSCKHGLLRTALLKTTPYLQTAVVYVEEESEEDDDGFLEAISAVICTAVVLMSSINLMLWL